MINPTGKKDTMMLGCFAIFMKLKMNGFNKQALQHFNSLSKQKEKGKKEKRLLSNYGI